MTKQQAPVQSWRLFLFRLLTRHPETSARFSQAETAPVEANAPPYGVVSVAQQVYERYSVRDRPSAFRLSDSCLNIPMAGFRFPSV